MRSADYSVYIPITTEQALRMHASGTGVSDVAMDVIKGIRTIYTLVYLLENDQIWGILIDRYSDLLHLSSEEIDSLTLLPTLEVKQEYIRQLIEERDNDPSTVI